MLNGNRSISNWNMPQSVVKLSGHDLSAQYQVTDSKDLDSNLNSLWANPLTNYSILKDINNIGSSVNPGKWEDTANNDNFYKLYAADKSILSDTNVIKPDLYDELRK